MPNITSKWSFKSFTLLLLNSYHLKYTPLLLVTKATVSTALLSNPPQRKENGNWHFSKYQHCAQQYVGFLYKNNSLKRNYFVILRRTILGWIARDYTEKWGSWNSNQGFSDSKAYTIYYTTLFLDEGGREVSFKAVAKFRCNWGLTLAALEEWRENHGGGTGAVVWWWYGGSNGPNLTTYWI